MSQTASTVVETSRALFGNISLPDGWRMIKLGEVCEVLSGFAWSSSYFKDTPPGLPIIRIQNLDENDRSKFVYWREEYDNRFLVNAGDLLLSLSGSFKTCIWNGQTGLLNQRIVRLIPHEELNQTWLLKCLEASLSEIAGMGKQAIVNNVSIHDLRSLEIPFPQLMEQERIAAILKEQMALVEQARAAALAQLKAAKDLPAAYLRSMFDSSEARQWAKKRIGDIALLVQNGIYKAAEHYGHGHPFLRMYNIQNNSWTLDLDRIALVHLEGKEEQTFTLKCGDLLISRVNSFELVGKCAWVSPDAEGFVFENMLIRVQLDSSVNSLFVAQQMATDAVRKQIEAVAKRAIGQASINSKDLRGIEISLPPLAVQEGIAIALAGKATFAKQASKRLQEQLDAINKLPAALLREALTGKF